MKIEDNFLKQEEFVQIQKLMGEPSPFPWFYTDRVISDYDTDKLIMFVHMFFDNHLPQPNYNIMIPLLELINPFSIIRIQANLLTRTPEIVESKFHVDLSLPEQQLKQWTTSIFYVNSNNGYTKFEDGTKVESVANRMVTFPANMKHMGSSCTNERTRVIINFNYGEKYEN